LPNEFKKVIQARQNVVHEYDAVECLILLLSKLEKGAEGGVPDLCKVLDAMIEGSTCTTTRPDDDPESDRTAQSIEDPEKSLGLIRGAVLINGHKYVLKAQHGGGTEEGGEEVRDDVERVVQVDGEEVFVSICISRLAEGGLGSGAFTTEGQPGRAGGHLVANEGRISVLDLLNIHRSSMSSAFFRVMRAQSREQVEHPSAFIHGWYWDRVARGLTRGAMTGAMSTSPCWS
jgi:hypothetical protein